MILAFFACAGDLARPVVAVDADELVWDAPGEQIVEVHNGGDVPLGVADLVWGGPSVWGTDDAAAFEVVLDVDPAEGLRGQIPPGGAGALRVLFTPFHEGAHDAIAEIRFADGDPALPATQRPTIDRRHERLFFWFHGEAPGVTPTRSRIGWRADATGAAPGEVVRIELLDDTADDDRWTPIGGGALPTYAFGFTWAPPSVDAPQVVQVQVVTTTEGSEGQDFVDLMAAPADWFDAPIPRD